MSKYFDFFKNESLGIEKTTYIDTKNNIAYAQLKTAKSNKKFIGKYDMLLKHNPMANQLTLSNGFTNDVKATKNSVKQKKSDIDKIEKSKGVKIEKIKVESGGLLAIQFEGAKQPEFYNSDAFSFDDINIENNKRNYAYAYKQDGWHLTPLKEIDIKQLLDGTNLIGGLAPQKYKGISGYGMHKGEAVAFHVSVESDAEVSNKKFIAKSNTHPLSKIFKKDTPIEIKNKYVLADVDGAVKTPINSKNMIVVLKNIENGKLVIGDSREFNELDKIQNTENINNIMLRHEDSMVYNSFHVGVDHTDTDIVESGKFLNNGIRNGLVEYSKGNVFQNLEHITDNNKIKESKSINNNELDLNIQKLLYVTDSADSIGMSKNNTGC